MQNGLLRDITEQEIQQFKTDGIVCLRGILANHWVETAQEGMLEMSLRPSPYATLVNKDEVYLYIDQMTSLFNDKLRSVAMDSGIGSIAKKLHGGAKTRWIFDQIFFKGKGMVAETPWHQDTAYGYLDGMNVTRIWIPLDPVPRETTLEVVRGSHKWNVEYATIETDKLQQSLDLNESSTDKFSYLDRTDESAPTLPDIEGNRNSFDIIGYEAAPGDLVVFNYHILHHASAGFNPDASRRAFAVIYADENTPFRKRSNMVPAVLEHVGKKWENGQCAVEFADAFPEVN